MGIKALTGGFTSEDLIVKKVENTGKVDKDGLPIRVTKYEPSDMLVFNPELNVYEIKEPNISLEPVTETEVDETEAAPEVETTNYSPFENI